ncbi:hypothetical protein OIU77_026909 [Salix suchowensis]|uniref:Uncharacterized protein n=1 Tax=Salix suchowensis TaxID=1278906 RepID=A0ABQ9BPI9_9ROSI|nr:hypothetical protein OIU77_026909 [Salix suchowensis]
MCRTTDFHGLQQSRTRENHLQIKSFYVLFTGFRPDNKPVPESLTLVYLPRGHELVIDGSEFRPATKAYLGLHRIVEVGKKEGEGEVMFGSRERVRVNEGVRFEVYLREERVLEGIFRRDADLERWKLECYGGTGGDDVRVLAVRVAVEGQVAFVETLVTRKRKSKRGCDRLEVIPEGERSWRMNRMVNVIVTGGDCTVEIWKRGVGQIVQRLRWNWRVSDGLLMLGFGSCVWVWVTWSLELLLRA